MSGTRTIYLVTALALAGIAAASVVLYRATERGVVQAYAAQQLAVSRTVAVAIGAELRALEVALRQLSALPSVQRPDLPYLQSRIRSSLEGIRMAALREVVRIDGQGLRHSWSSTGEPRVIGAPGGTPEAVWAWASDRASRGTLRLESIWWDADTPASHRVLVIPVWHDSPSAEQPVAPNTFTGLLGLVVDSESLVGDYEHASAVQALGGALVLALDDGQIVRAGAIPANDLDLRALPSLLADRPDGTEIPREVAASVVSWSRVAIVGHKSWLVIIATPYARAAADVRQNAAGQLAATATLLIAVPIVAWSLVRRERLAEEERRALQGQLLQSQKMDAIGKLAGGVAHDFNNLLTAILGYTSLILEESPKGSTIHTGASQVRRAAESAATLTQKLLAFSRRQVLQPQPVDLGALLLDLQGLLKRLLGETVDLSVTADAGVWPVVADPVQIEQVVINLAVNARDAMPTGGRLAIHVANAPLPEGEERRDHKVPKGDYVRVVVRDTGVGMDEATLARLFEPFFTTKPQGKGTGLGLSTVYGIVKQSGGYVNVDSAPGQGTTIQLLFPRAAADRATVKRRPESGRYPRGTETVLLVEDDAAVRELTQATLERHGYRVLSAAGPEEALEIVRGHSGALQLLLSDVVMPGMLGPELARHVKALRPDIKLLFMSGYAADVVTPELLAEGALLQKPFSVAVLTRTVRLVLDSTAERASA
ncbi:MAG: ATP-binding protein [Acidobacteriota bacterium]